MCATDQAEKFIRLMPIVVLSFAGLTLAFAVVGFPENNMTTGIVLCLFAASGIYLANPEKVEAGMETKQCRPSSFRHKSNLIRTVNKHNTIMNNGRITIYLIS